MNIGVSSFIINITPCNVPYTDNSYRVVARSFSNNTIQVPRRYIPGGYVPFSNQFIFNYFPPGLSNGISYYTLTPLRPDTSYYYTINVTNKITSNAPQIYNGLTRSNFIRTSIPSPPTYINNANFYSINTINTYSAIPCISNIYGNSAIVSNIIATPNLIFRNSNLIGIHHTSNTGSLSNSLCTVRVNIFENQTLLTTQDIGLDSFTGLAKSTSNNRSIVISVSNYQDYYSSQSNFTGFYNTVASNNFITRFNFYGEGGISNITSPFLKTMSITQTLQNGTIFSNSFQQYYTDGLNSATSTSPTININNTHLITFSQINPSNIIYINGMLSFAPSITFSNVIIGNLYKSFLATGDIIYTRFRSVQDFPYSNYDIDSFNAMNSSNLIIYTTEGAQINIPQTPVAPDSVVINNFTIDLGTQLFSQSSQLDKVTSLLFTAKSYLGEVNINASIQEFLNIENIPYWDLPSVEVLSNTSEANITLSKGYGIRVTSGIFPGDGTPKWEQVIVFLGEPYGGFSLGFNDKLLSNFGGVFDHTINLMNEEPYKYELPLFGGYYQTVNFSNWYNDTYNTNINFGYKNNNIFENTFSAQYNYNYPDYTNLANDSTNSTYFRYASFKYTIPAGSIINKGICMIQFINNNFIMDTETSWIRDSSTEVYDYYNYLIQYKIVTSDSNYATAWFSLQDFAIPSINFEINQYYLSGPGALTQIPFIDNNGIEYVNSASNRVFLIPTNIENFGFDLFIRVGIPKSNIGGFQYISTCFNLI